MTNRNMQKPLPLSKPQRRVLTAMQMRGADAKYDRVDISAAYTTMYSLERLGLVAHQPGVPDTWWLTEKGKKVQP